METYTGQVRTPQDAIILFEACRLGLLPRVQRRLSEKERQQIRSGSVFVWDEREAGMRRWTDGKSWSASRVAGSFLTYREMEGKRGSNGFTPPARRSSSKSGDVPKTEDSELDGGEDGPDGYRYKPDGLMKQSFSITTSSGQHLHLISYYARSHPNAGNLNQPSSDPSLRNIRPHKGLYPESALSEPQNMSSINRSPMSKSPFAPLPRSAGGTPPFPRPGVTHTYGYMSPAGFAWPSGPAPAQSPQSGPYYSQGAVGHLSLPPAQQHYSSQPSTQSTPSTSFDRTPPSLNNSELPPPPPLPHHHIHNHTQNGHAPHGYAAGPQYVPQLSPRIAQAAELAQQQARAALQHPIDYSRPAAETQSASLMSSTTASKTSQQPQHDSRSVSCLMHAVNGGQLPSPVSPASKGAAPVSHPPASDSLSVPELPNGSSMQSKVIPGIGALISSTVAERASPEVKSEHSTSRAGSRSPANMAHLSTQDVIQPERSFTEDMRALRQLDTAFSVK